MKMMIKAKLDADLRLKKHYDNEVKKGICALMVETANEAGITRMEFSPFDSVFKRGEDTVESLALDNLDHLYWLNFGETNFLGVWTAVDGWWVQ